MRIALATAVLVFLRASAASAQSPDPPVMDGMFSYYDLDAFKGGEWVEYETTMTVHAGDKSRSTTTSWKTSCVGIDGDTVLFETTTPLQSVPDWKDFVVLVAVDRKSGKVTKAWWGKPGETGKELKVTPSPVAPANSEVTGTGKVSRDTVSAAGSDYECEKIETDLVMKSGNSGEMKIKSSSWNSEKMPFHTKSLPAAAKAMVDKLKWETQPTGKGFMVKSESAMEATNYSSKSSTVLKACGTDAKATLKK
jgi:hypothetical protein